MPKPTPTEKPWCIVRHLDGAYTIERTYADQQAAEKALRKGNRHFMLGGSRFVLPTAAARAQYGL